MVTDTREKLEALRADLSHPGPDTVRDWPTVQRVLCHHIDAILDAMPEGPDTDSGWIDVRLLSLTQPHRPTVSAALREVVGALYKLCTSWTYKGRCRLSKTHWHNAPAKSRRTARMGERAEKLDAADVIARQSAEIAALKAENERLRAWIKASYKGLPIYAWDEARALLGEGDARMISEADAREALEKAQG